MLTTDQNYSAQSPIPVLKPEQIKKLNLLQSQNLCYRDSKLLKSQKTKINLSSQGQAYKRKRINSELTNSNVQLNIQIKNLSENSKIKIKNIRNIGNLTKRTHKQTDLHRETHQRKNKKNSIFQSEEIFNNICCNFMNNKTTQDINPLLRARILNLNK